MHNPFKKWKKSNFSPVPLGLSLEIWHGATSCLPQPSLPPWLCVHLVLGMALWHLGGDSHWGLC